MRLGLRVCIPGMPDPDKGGTYRSSEKRYSLTLPCCISKIEQARANVMLFLYSCMQARPFLSYLPWQVVSYQKTLNQALTPLLG